MFQVNDAQLCLNANAPNEDNVIFSNFQTRPFLQESVSMRWPRINRATFPSERASWPAYSR